jgi:hypothetical protein
VTIQLNLDGHTVTSTNQYVVQNKGTLTIDGGDRETGKIVGNYTNQQYAYGVRNEKDATITLKNLTVTADYYAVYNQGSVVEIDNCSLISDAGTALYSFSSSATGTFGSIKNSLLQTNGNGNALQKQTWETDQIGSIENTQIISTSPDTTQAALYINGHSGGDWSSASKSDIGYIKNCTIKTNDAANAPAIRLEMSGRIYSLTDSVVSGGSNAIEVEAYGDPTGIRSLNAEVTAHNGDIVKVTSNYTSMAGTTMNTETSGGALTVNFEGGYYKTSTGYLYNVDDGLDSGNYTTLYLYDVNDFGQWYLITDENDAHYGYYAYQTKGTDTGYYRVNFYSENGKRVKAATAAVTKGSYVTAPTVSPSKANEGLYHYTFLGWGTVMGSYNASDVIDLTTYPITANTDFYPVYLKEELPPVVTVEASGNANEYVSGADASGKYLTFQEVLDAMTDYCPKEVTITLNQDTTLDNSGGMSYGTNAVLDLNGHTLTINGNSWGYGLSFSAYNFAAGVSNVKIISEWPGQDRGRRREHHQVRPGQHRAGPDGDHRGERHHLQ